MIKVFCMLVNDESKTMCRKTWEVFERITVKVTGLMASNECIDNSHYYSLEILFSLVTIAQNKYKHNLGTWNLAISDADVLRFYNSKTALMEQLC